MNTNRTKSRALKTLEAMTGAPLTVSDLLWAIRKSDGLSQTEFAQRLCISNQYLCDLEHGRKSLSPKKAKEFAEVLGYSVEQFVALALQDALTQDGIHFIVELKEAA